MDKPRTFNGDLSNLPAALERLTAEQRWLVWRWELRGKKSDEEAQWTKPPYMARFPKKHAMTDNPETWGPYADAVAAVAAGDADGIGYALLGSDLGAIDLDKCRNPMTGEVAQWAEELHVEADGAYHEVTVSGRGTRILGTANGPSRQRRFNLNDGAGIELFRNTKKYITISGNARGSCAALPPIDDLIDALEERYDAQKGRKSASSNTFDFNDAARQSPDYDDLIRNGAPDGGDRSELFHGVVWHLAGKGMTADEITDELAQYPNGIGAKYADRLHAEVLRSYDKWRAHRHSDATGSDDGAAPWPEIYIVRGELPRIVNEAETALLGLGRGIYQRGGMIVRPAFTPVKTFHDQDTEAWRILEVSSGYFAETLARAARWYKYNGRSKMWVAADVPRLVIEAYQGRVGEWKLPVLTGITGTPQLRRDGSLHDTPGYDPVTGLLYKPECEFDPAPERPTKDDAIAALGMFNDLLAGFPFVTLADKAVTLSAILTALDRHNMPTAPLHGFSATVAGTGKSKLVDIVSILATGRSAAVKAQPGTEDELEKRLNSELLQGATIITIDNCEHPLQCAFLCTMLTQETVSIRPLGQSRTVDASTAATVMATGNNLQITGDLTRRALLCSLDARCEHPERRPFDWDAKDIAQAQRGRLVSAALTILRAWHAAGTRIDRSPLGGFEEWSQRIRAPLLWLGCADPCDTTLKLKAQDAQVMELVAVMACWKEHIGLNAPLNIQGIINKALAAPDLQNALLVVAEARGRSVISSDRFGRWLRKVEGRIVSGNAIRQAGVVHGYQHWVLTG
jgi:putative DNA primase/helicase